jgi:predicted PurR-regulated permease PerM
MTLWDGRTARITFTAAVVVGALYAVYAIRRTLFVFLLAVFFAYMVYPLVLLLDRFRPRRVPEWVSPVIAVILILTMLVLIGTWVGPPIADEASRLGDQLPDLLKRADAVDAWPWPDFLRPYAGRIVALLQTEIQGGATEALPLARRISAGLVQAAGDAFLVVLVPILAFLFVLNGRRIRAGLSRLVAGRQAWEGTIDELDQLFGRYIRALLLLSLAAFAAYAIFLSSAGVPYGLLLAAIAALLEFIPVFGPLASALTIVVVAGLAGYSHLLWIVSFIVAYRIVQDYLLAPKLMGAGVGVPPILVLFGLLAGGEIAGVPGIFLSVPAIAAAITIGRHVIENRSRSRERAERS